MLLRMQDKIYNLEKQLAEKDDIIKDLKQKVVDKQETIEELKVQIVECNKEIAICKSLLVPGGQHEVSNSVTAMVTKMIRKITHLETLAKCNDNDIKELKSEVACKNRAIEKLEIHITEGVNGCQCSCPMWDLSSMYRGIIDRQEEEIAKYKRDIENDHKILKPGNPLPDQTRRVLDLVIKKDVDQRVLDQRRTISDLYTQLIKERRMLQEWRESYHHAEDSFNAQVRDLRNICTRHNIKTEIFFVRPSDLDAHNARTFTDEHGDSRRLGYREVQRQVNGE